MAYLTPQCFSSNNNQLQFYNTIMKFFVWKVPTTTLEVINNSRWNCREKLIYLIFRCCPTIAKIKFHQHCKVKKEQTAYEFYFVKFIHKRFSRGRKQIKEFAFKSVFIYLIFDNEGRSLKNVFRKVFCRLTLILKHQCWKHNYD